MLKVFLFYLYSPRLKTHLIIIIPIEATRIPRTCIIEIGLFCRKSKVQVNVRVITISYIMASKTRFLETKLTTTQSWINEPYRYSRAILDAVWLALSFLDRIA